jgi:cyclic pyranopterin monophosphate synthase
MLFARAMMCNRGAGLAASPAFSRYHRRPTVAAKLSHSDSRGRARMVDVAAKPETLREAVASAEVRMQPATLRLVERAVGARGKGDVLAVARLAGVMAAKRTADLIPLCHPVRLVGCDVELRADRRLPGVRVEARARAVDRTGVEMEAMVAVAVAALTVYDMVKGAERGVEIRGVRLDEKRGGKSGSWSRPSRSKPIAKVRSSK